MEWSETTKLLIGILGILVGLLLLVQLRGLIAPLLAAFILVLLLHPASAWLHEHTPLPWPLSVAAVFMGGIGLVALVLLWFGRRLVEALTDLAASAQAGGAAVESAAHTAELGQVVGLIVASGSRFMGVLVTNTVALVGSLVFILAVAFFVILEGGAERRLKVPSRDRAFGADFALLRSRIGAIWSTWIYSRVVLCVMTFTMYLVTMTVLGVDNALGIAAVSVVGRFVPNVGAVVTWSAVFVSAFTQGSNPFGLEPLAYALLCVGLSILVDQSFDNFVAPKIYGEAFKLPAAAVTVGLAAGGMLLGFFGMFTVAPIKATMVVVVKLLGAHIIEVEAPEDDGDQQPPGVPAAAD